VLPGIRSLRHQCGHGLTALRHHFQVNALRNVFLAGTLLKLLRLLEAHGIAALPYKGPVLAALAYGNVAFRQFGDLDLLVRPQDADRAKALLWAQGYCWLAGRGGGHCHL
jgi:Uncharacterised nucleotidyltransferase